MVKYVVFDMRKQKLIAPRPVAAGPRGRGTGFGVDHALS